jgi:hypothetical protein
MTSTDRALALGCALATLVDARDIGEARCPLFVPGLVGARPRHLVERAFDALGLANEEQEDARHK